MLFMAYIFQVLSFLLLVPAVLVVSYYMFLAIVALLNRGKGITILKENNTKFVIVVPAHNEESTLQKTLSSCALLDYPSDQYQIYVVADNCTDKTAQIAKNAGVTCLERENLVERGKGYALAYAFKNVLEQDFDAVIVLDADCEIDNHALKVFDAYLQSGEEVLQANDVASNPDDSPMSYAVAVGNMIENNLYYSAKTKIGLPVILRGTGMVFTTNILRKHPWDACSIVEDMEYSLSLIRAGVKTKFIEEASVRSDFPATKEQLDIQRTRWAAGNLGYGKTDAISFIKEGFQSGPKTLIDVGWSMLVLSRPLVMLELLICLVLVCVSYWLSPDLFSICMVVTAMIVLVLQVVYFSLGIIMLGISVRRIILLLKTPYVILRLIVISLKGLMGVGIDKWARTPRS